jgi:hypothetical protein
MIKLVLDTTAFHQNSTLKGQDFKLIETLSASGALKLYLPYVVEKEFLTQQSASCHEQIEALVRAVKNLSQRALAKEQVEWLTAIDSKMEDCKPAMLSADKTNLNDWLGTIKAERVGVCQQQAVEALDAYFHGSPPLKQAKARKDIPDSFVFQAVRKIASDDEQVIFISGDTQMREAVEKLSNVRAFENLKTFAQSPEIQALISQEDEKQRIEKFKECLPNNLEAIKILSEVVKANVGEKVVWKKVGGDEYGFDESDATITSYDTAQEPSFKWDELLYYGDGSFSLPFTVTMGVLITYYIFKSDWYCMDTDEAPSVTDHNDHYFEAERDDEVLIEGVLSFSVCDDVAPEDESILDHESVEIDSIESIETVSLEA